MRKIPCAILCGGKSSRMGSNKALLEFCHRPLVEYMYEKMQKIFDEVYLVCKDDSVFSGFSHLVIQEQSKIYAPIFGIEAVLQRLERVFFISVDTPFIQKDQIEKLLQAMGDEQILYAKTPKKSHFLCGIYHQSIMSKVKEMIKKEDFRMAHLVSQTQSVFVEFLEENAFDNLNTPLEYQNALKRIEQNG